MKILDFITGIGYGHTIRQTALLNFLKKKNSKFVIATYGNSLDYFEKKLPTIDIKGPKFPEKSGKLGILKTMFINLKLPYYYLSNYKKLQTTLKVFKPDIILTDFEPIALYLDNTLPHFLIFNFDPEIYKEFIKNKKNKFKPQKKYIDWVYNKAKKINCPIIIPSLLGQKKSKDFNYINPIIREIPTASEKILLRKLKLNKSPIIIMLGGSHFGDELLKKIISIIKDIDEEFLIFGYKLHGKKHKNITFMPFKENFLEYLKVSKGIITMAGHGSLSECVILKKPSLIFPIQNSLEQLLNAFEMKKNNLAMINDSKNPSKGEIKSSIEEFLNNLKNLQKNLDKLNVKSNGAEQVYNIIKENS